jgi:peptide/nickel transport system substrate-binding protein
MRQSGRTHSPEFTFMGRLSATLLSASAGLLLASCARGDRPCGDCGTVRIAAVREPASIFPPLVFETVGRDIGDRVYERLANLQAGGATIDPTAYRPALASAWERVDSVSWRFHLRPGALWHDSVSVTASDVVFSFAAYTDSTLETGAASALEGVTAEALDSSTVLVHFPRYSPEQLYDATWHVRILPKHIWSSTPPAAWTSDTSMARLVGSGPYRVSSWERGTMITLDADPAWRPAPAVRRLVWRFTPDPDAALNLVLSREAELLEQAGAPAQAARASSDTALRVIPYPSAVYGFAAFNFAGTKGKLDARFGDRAVRQALVLGVDRATLARAVFGPNAAVPEGPVSRLQWIAGEGITTLPFDTTAAAALLDSAGWKRDASGVRRHGTTRLAFGLLVPSTSASRKLLAEALQESWKRLGAEVTIDAVDFPVFQQRLAAGKFDVYIGAYLDEPSPHGIVDQWTRAGWGALNYGQYANPVVDSLIGLALEVSELGIARTRWHEVLDSMNADAPAVFLYTPEQSAVMSRRITGVSIDPWSWLEGIERWGLEPGQALK